MKQNLSFILFTWFLMTCTIFGAEKPNILWITAEDIGPQLGSYGDKFAQTPHLDAFAKNAQSFLNVWSNAPVCAPARTTIISGMYPTSTGSEHMRCSVPLPEGHKMFPQLLREAGYYCSNNNKEDYNLQKTGDVWDMSSAKAHWKNRAAGQPFFAVFNLNITHESQIRKVDTPLTLDPANVPVPPYHPDTPEVRRDWTQYYQNITTMDGQFQARLQELQDAGLAEDTIVFFFGDHGAGMPRHKRYVYNSGLRVPLIAYFPEKWKHLAPKGYEANAQNSALTSFVDLAPSVLSLAGVKAPDYFQGRAFCGPAAADKPDAEFLFGFRGRMDERYDLSRSVTDGRYVYIRNYLPHLPYGQHVSYMFQTKTTQVWQELAEKGQLTEVQSAFWKPKAPEEFYDLQSDPWEVKNLAAVTSHPALSKLRHALDRHLLQTRDLGFIPEAERVRISEKRSPYDVAQSPDVYPLEEILSFAKYAMSTDLKEPGPFIKGLNYKNAILRYWAVIGLRVREKDGVERGREVLLRALTDESPSVRIAAAEALGQFGKPEDLTAALNVLIAEADGTKTGYFTALDALNGLNALQKKALPVREKIALLPKEVPETDKRVAEYLGRLLEKTLADLQ